HAARAQDGAWHDHAPANPVQAEGNQIAGGKPELRGEIPERAVHARDQEERRRYDERLFRGHGVGDGVERYDGNRFMIRLTASSTVASIHVWSSTTPSSPRSTQPR